MSQKKSKKHRRMPPEVAGRERSGCPTKLTTLLQATQIVLTLLRILLDH